MKIIFGLNLYFNFMFLCLISGLLIYLRNYLLISEDIYYQSLSERFTFERIRELIDDRKKWFWVNYISIPFILIIKFSLVSSSLWLGAFFFNRKVSFSDLFGVAMLAELISQVPPVLKIFWFFFIQTDYTLTDLQQFSPFSALSLFEEGTIQPYLVYPLHLLSVWEIGYWILLAYGLSRVIGNPLTKSLQIVAVSYGSGLLLWVVFGMYLSVSMGA